MKCSVCYGKLVGPHGNVGSNMYLCDAEDSLPYVHHQKICIVCVYTHYRTLLLAGQTLKCFDPQCMASPDVERSSNIAVCSLNADEYAGYVEQRRAVHTKCMAEGRRQTALAAAQDSFKTLAYAAEHTKRCPACTVRVAKVSGCCQVTCQHCGTGFWWDQASNEVDADALSRRLQSADRQGVCTRSRQRLLNELV
jgi:hypothetical protein